MRHARRIVRFGLPAFAVLVLLAGCGKDAGSPSPAGDGPALARLPVAGLVGDLPARTHRVDVALDADGRLTVNGEACAERDLVARLQAATGGAADEVTRQVVITSTTGPEDEDLEEVDEESGAADDGDVISDGVISDAPIVDAADRPVVAPEADEDRPYPFGPDGSRTADVLLRLDPGLPWEEPIEESPR